MNQPNHIQTAPYILNQQQSTIPFMASMTQSNHYTQQSSQEFSFEQNQQLNSTQQQLQQVTQSDMQRSVEDHDIKCSSQQNKKKGFVKCSKKLVSQINNKQTQQSTFTPSPSNSITISPPKIQGNEQEVTNIQNKKKNGNQKKELHSPSNSGSADQSSDICEMQVLEQKQPNLQENYQNTQNCIQNFIETQKQSQSQEDLSTNLNQRINLQNISLSQQHDSIQKQNQIYSCNGIQQNMQPFQNLQSQNNQLVSQSQTQKQFQYHINQFGSYNNFFNQQQQWPTYDQYNNLLLQQNYSSNNARDQQIPPLIQQQIQHLQQQITPQIMQNSQNLIQTQQQYPLSISSQNQFYQQQSLNMNNFNIIPNQIHQLDSYIANQDPSQQNKLKIENAYTNAELDIQVNQNIQKNNQIKQEEKTKQTSEFNQTIESKNKIQFKNRNKEDKQPLNTSHVPINMMNNLVTYLIKFYEKNLMCKCQNQSSNVNSKQKQQLTQEKIDNKLEDAQQNMCDRCVELQKIINMKKSKIKNISSFQKLWDNQRVRALSENYFLQYSFLQILNKKYRSQNNRQALLECLTSFLSGVRNPHKFWKLI